MRTEKTDWPTDFENTVAPIHVATLDQPGFGMELFWNTPKLWQPTFVVHFWRWQLTIGWMVP